MVLDIFWQSISEYRVSCNPLIRVSDVFGSNNTAIDFLLGKCYWIR